MVYYKRTRAQIEICALVRFSLAKSSHHAKAMMGAFRQTDRFTINS